jgi:hypothetical protein
MNSAQYSANRNPPPSRVGSETDEILNEVKTNFMIAIRPYSDRIEG